MVRKLQSIPQPTHIDSETRKILVPVIDAVNRRILGGSNERVITRQDLIDLGVVTQSQVNTLEN